MENDLFVYGTLVDPRFREQILGRRIDAIPARLLGFERGRRKHFYVAPRANAEVTGVILSGLRGSDFVTLDDYEDVPRLYTRERIAVVDAGGRSVECWIYLPTRWHRGG